MTPTSYLLTQVAKNHLGEVASSVVSQLISHGRLSAGEIASKADLPPKAIRQALVSLVQLNCVSYWKESRYIYSLNEEGLLCLVHAGEIIAHIRQQYGTASAEIIQNVLLHGHVQLEQYMGGMEPAERIEQETLFFRLFQEKWLVRIVPSDLHPREDVWAHLFAETAKQTPRTSATSEVKRLAEVKERTKTKYLEQQERKNAFDQVYHTEGGIKKLRADLCVRFNLARLRAAQRTDALVSLVRVRVGTLTATVYETALRSLEKNAPVEHDFERISGLINDPDEHRQFVNATENRLVEERKTVFNVRDLVRLLPSDLDLRNSIISRKREREWEGQATNKRARVGSEGEVKEETSLAADALAGVDSFIDSLVEDPIAVPLVESHLKLLAQGTRIQFLAEMTPGTYTVPYTALARTLRTHTFETLVKTTLGSNAFRLLRCLKSLGLGDEKSIASAVLLKEKTVRNELYKLVRLNCVEIQEVPRSVDRAAAKTFFLFRHREPMSYNHMQKSVMYCMGQILSNIEALHMDNRILLDKCEREDVKGQEEELLLDLELRTLRDLQKREVNNMGRFQRLARLVNIYS